MIQLETERLVLRNYTMEDVASVYEYFSNEDVTRYEDFNPMTIEEVEEELSEWINMDNRMLVVLKSTHEVLGSVGYWIDEDGDYSIDYDFNPKFWNKGYATEAAREVVRYLKDNKGVKVIYGDCDARNTASARDYKDGNLIKITMNVYKFDFNEFK